MLEGFKPLDLSFLQTQPVDFSKFSSAASGMPNTQSIAQKITSGMNWGQQPTDLSKQDSPQEPTFWGGLMDLLSSGNYAVANGIQGGLDAIKNNPNDGTGGKILDFLGGGVKGGLEGLGAGITSGAAGMTGLSDNTARDTFGKTRFADLIRNNTALSPKLDPTDGKLYMPEMVKDPATGQYVQGRSEISPQNAKAVLTADQLVGMYADMVFDPLTYTGLGVAPKMAEAADLNKTVDANAAIKGLNKSVGATEGLNSGLAQSLPTIENGGKQLQKVNGVYKLVDTTNLGSAPITDVTNPLAKTTPSLPEGLTNTALTNTATAETPVAKNIVPSVTGNPLNTAATAMPPVAEKLPSVINEVKPIEPAAATATAPPDFSNFLHSMMNSGELSAAKSGEPVSNVLHSGTLLDDATQAKLAGKLGSIIQRGVTPQQVYRDATLFLKTNHADVQFPNLVGYLDKIRNTTDFTKFKALMNYGGSDTKIGSVAADLRKRVIGGIQDAIKKDSLATPVAGSPIKSASDIIAEVAKGTRSVAPNVAPASRFGKAEDVILSDVIKKYGNQIKTGMYESLQGPSRGYFQRALETGANVKWSGPKQANVWDTLLKRLGDTGNLKYATNSKYTKALNMLRAFEEHYMSLGHTPYSAAKSVESVPLRLSDVIARIGQQNFAKHGDLITTILRSSISGGEIKPGSAAAKVIKENPEIARQVANAIQEAKAGSAIAEAPAIEEGMQAGKTSAENLINENAMSAARRAEAVTSAQKTAQQVAQIAGASKSGAAHAADWIKSEYALKDPVGEAISSNHFNTLTQLSGKIDRATVDFKYSNAPAVTRAIEKQLGPIASVANKVGPAAKTEEWLGARFNAAYRNADMRPIYLANMASAKATVSLRARQINSIVHQFGNDGDLWHEAMQVAQGTKLPATAEVKGLAEQLSKVMEDLFGGSGLRKGAEIENSVVGRAQILRQELNQQLKKFGINHEFSNDVVKGNDYRQGTDWMKSWETWNVKNPMQLMYQIQNAVENTVRTRTMFDEIISRFGTFKSGHATANTLLDAKTLKKYPYFNGVKFEPHMAEQAQQFLKLLTETNQPNSKALQYLDNIMSKWKSSVTIYKPSHYIRNLTGDTMFNWLAGVDSTKPYGIAIKAMKSQKGKYEWETGNLADLTSPDALKNAIAKGASATGPTGSNIAFTMANGQHVTNDMLYISAFQKGLLPSVRILEDLPDSVPSLLDKVHLPGKFQGKIQETVHNIHEQRDHFIRLAHFTDALMKSKGSFENSIQEASRIVRKWHPDGMDMTKFERQTLRRVFPFYSWTRKSIPLAIESIYTTPSKVMLYPRLQYGAQTLLMGQSGGVSPSDPYPQEQLWPDWMREKGIGPLWGTPGNYSFINPSNPIQDLATQFGDSSRMIGNGFSAKGINGVTQMVNPLVKTPAEVMTGTNTQTQAPITDWTQYFTGQVPGISDMSRLSNVDLGGSSPKMADQGFGNMQSIINYLTAAGYTQTTPKTAVGGELAMKDYLKRLKNG